MLQNTNRKNFEIGESENYFEQCQICEILNFKTVFLAKSKNSLKEHLVKTHNIFSDKNDKISENQEHNSQIMSISEVKPDHEVNINLDDRGYLPNECPICHLRYEPKNRKPLEIQSSAIE